MLFFGYLITGTTITTILIVREYIKFKKEGK